MAASFSHRGSVETVTVPAQRAPRCRSNAGLEESHHSPHLQLLRGGLPGQEKLRCVSQLQLGRGPLLTGSPTVLLSALHMHTWDLVRIQVGNQQIWTGSEGLHAKQNPVKMLEDIFGWVAGVPKTWTPRPSPHQINPSFCRGAAMLWCTGRPSGIV